MDTSWASALPSLVVYAVVVLVPGAIMGRLLGIRRTLLWALATPLTMSVLTVGAATNGLLRIPWGRGSILAICFAGILFALLVGSVFAARAVGVDSPVLRRPPTRSHTAGVVAIVVGIVATGIPILRGMGRPDELVDSPDVVFHLSRMRSILEGGSPSSFGDRFYPSGYHDLAIAGTQFGATSDLVTAGNLVAVLAAAVIWPIGCVALGRQLFGWRPVTLILSGLVAAAFIQFPAVFFGWGVLWPNLLGTAMLPGVLAAAVASFGRQEIGGSTKIAIRTGTLLTLPGLFLVHPNALVTFALFIWVWALTHSVGKALRRQEGGSGGRGRGWAVLSVAGLVLSAVLVVVVLPRISSLLTMTSSYVWSERPSVGASVADIVLGTLGWPHVQWGAAVLVAAGIVWVLWRGRHLVAVVAAWVVGVVLFVIAASDRSELGRMLTGFWYNDKYRIAAFTVIPASMLAVAGLVGAGRLLRRWLERRMSGSRAPLASGALAVVALLVLTSGLRWGETREIVRIYYLPATDPKTVATQEMIEELRHLDSLIPRGARLAAAPESGAPLLYALTGRPVLFSSIPPIVEATRVVVGKGLVDVADDPAVCRAVRELDVRYAITSDHTYVIRDPSLTVGITSIPTRGTFEKIAATAHYTLWKVPDCSA